MADYNNLTWSQTQNRRLDVSLDVLQTPELESYYPTWSQIEVDDNGKPRDRRHIVPTDVIKPIVQKILDKCYKRCDEVGRAAIRQAASQPQNRIFGPTILVMDARAIEIVFECTEDLKKAEDWGMIRKDNEKMQCSYPNVGCWDGGFEPRIFGEAHREHFLSIQEDQGTIPYLYLSYEDEEWQCTNGHKCGLEVYLRSKYRMRRKLLSEQEVILIDTMTAILTVKDVIVRNPDWHGTLMDRGETGYQRQDRVWNQD